MENENSVIEYYSKKLGVLLSIVYKLRRQNVSSIIDELVRLDKTNSEQYQTYINDKITELMMFISNNNKYYGNALFDEPINASNAFKVFTSLPFTNKKIIKNNYDQFICKQIRGEIRSTSGTTGLPFVFSKDTSAASYMDAMMYNVYGWHGIQPWDRQARLWGRAVSFKSKLLQAAKDYLLGRRRLSAFAMNDANSKNYYNVLKKHKPKYFYCYSNAIYQFALSVEKQGLKGKELNIPYAICTGEVLFKYQREKIEQIFGCRVINEYGSTENGIIGFECEYNTMHVLPTVYLDIVGPDSDGFGEIAVTELNSRSIPFVKYKNGDVGKLITAHKCSCRRPFPALEIRDGRIDSYIQCPNGDIVYDALLAYIFKDKISQFKAIQETINVIDIQIVPIGDFSFSDINQYESKLKSYLGKEMNIKFSIVDSIVPERSGKLRYFISKMNHSEASGGVESDLTPGN